MDTVSPRRSRATADRLRYKHLAHFRRSPTGPDPSPADGAASEYALKGSPRREALRRPRADGASTGLPSARRAFFTATALSRLSRNRTEQQQVLVPGIALYLSSDSKLLPHANGVGNS